MATIFCALDIQLSIFEYIELFVSCHGRCSLFDRHLSSRINDAFANNIKYTQTVQSFDFLEILFHELVFVYFVLIRIHGKFILRFMV